MIEIAICFCIMGIVNMFFPKVAWYINALRPRSYHTNLSDGYDEEIDKPKYQSVAKFYFVASIIFIIIYILTT